MKGGHLLYKCRLCGGLVKIIHVPDVMTALAHLVHYSMTPKDWGMICHTTTTHNCGVNSIGVADIIGGEEDNE